MLLLLLKRRHFTGMSRAPGSSVPILRVSPFVLIHRGHAALPLLRVVTPGFKRDCTGTGRDQLQRYGQPYVLYVHQSAYRNFFDRQLPPQYCCKVLPGDCTRQPRHLSVAWRNGHYVPAS
jgi:hypothetical protein